MKILKTLGGPSMKYENLFTPIRLGNTLFRNRIFAAPNGYHDLTSDHCLTPEFIAFFERKAIGGAASVTIGECIVDSQTGAAHQYHFFLDNPKALPSLSSYAMSIKRHGAVPSVELQHCGMFSHAVYEQGLPLYGPSEMAIPDEHKINNDGHETFVSPDGLRHIREMTEEDIERLIHSFAKAAAFAKQCGCGMVMIHAGHGWGLSQFLSPYYNRRTDRWGGSIENRARLPLAVVEAVRKAVGPAFPIEVRISADELTPTGYGLDDGIAFARLLDGKADLINASVGHHETPEATSITHPSMFLEAGCNVKYAAEIKKHVRTPVSAVGALADPELMEEIIASGKADLIELGRQTLADPDLPVKTRLGREDEVGRCLRCCMCFSSGTKNRQRICSINPEVGHNYELKFDIPPAHKKTVLVAGGGIAGMQAALTADARGHRVILCEKTDRLGGVLNCERGVPFKEKFDQYLTRQALLVSRSGIEVRLNTTVTPALAEELKPDVILCAIGSRASVPKIPGIDRANVIAGEEAYRSPEKVGQTAVIMGGGLVGTELAIYLNMLGRKVSVVEMAPALNDGGNVVHGGVLSRELAARGIPVLLNTKALSVDETGLNVSAPDGEKHLEADTVINAAGRAPLWAEADTLRFCAPEFHQIGDCLSVANMAEANRAAFTAARDIGRF